MAAAEAVAPRRTQTRGSITVAIRAGCHHERVFTWPDDDDMVPGPELVAAWQKLDLLTVDRLPVWAAHWIAAGHDGSALVELAGRSEGDPVLDLVEPALQDCGFSGPTMHDARRTAFSAVAAVMLAGHIDEFQVALEYSQIMVAGDGWTDPEGEPTLLRLFDLDDDWRHGNRSIAELRATVRDVCRQWMPFADTGLLHRPRGFDN